MMLRERIARSNGFTLVELITVVAIIALLASLLIPSFAAAKRAAYRSKCASNLREIVRACDTYAQEKRMSKGRRSSEVTLPCPSTPTGAPAVTASNWRDMSQGNAGCMWLLVQHKYTSARSFNCPEAVASGEKQETTDSATGFTAKTLSYSFASMVAFSDVLFIDLSPGYVLVGDANPRVGASSFDNSAGMKNSRNHGGQGQNIAHRNQSAEYIRESKVSLTSAANKDDDIYLPGPPGTADGSNGARLSKDDVFLIP